MIIDPYRYALSSDVPVSFAYRDSIIAELPYYYQQFAYSGGTEINFSPSMEGSNNAGWTGGTRNSTGGPTVDGKGRGTFTRISQSGFGTSLTFDAPYGMTFAFWIKPSSSIGGGEIISKRQGNASSFTAFPFAIFHDHAGRRVGILADFGNDFSGDQVIYSATNALTNDAWNFVVIVMRTVGSAVDIYVNGVLSSSTTLTAQIGIASPSYPWKIGGAANEYDAGIGGYGLRADLGEVAIFNRMLSATRIAELYNIALGTNVGGPVNYVINCPFDGTDGSTIIIDTSANPKTLTCYGNAVLATGRPGSTPPAVSLRYGGAGTPGYVKATYDSSMALGTSDFTLSMNMYPTNTNTFNVLATQQSTTSSYDTPFQLAFESTVVRLRVANSTGTGWIIDKLLNSGPTQILGNQGVSIHLKRRGNVLFVGVNSQDTVAYSFYLPDNFSFYESTNPWTFGANGDGSDCSNQQAWIDSIQFIKGSFRHGTPEIKDAFHGNVSTLLLMQGTNGSTTITDNAPTPKTWTCQGNAQLSTTQAMWAGAGNRTSLYLDGTGDWISTPSHSDFDFGSGDFTIEMWVYPTGSVTSGLIVKRANTSIFAPFYILMNSTRAIQFLASVNGTSWGYNWTGAVIPLNTWSHIAFSRRGTRFVAGINGAISGSSTTLSGALTTNATDVVIGAAAADGSSPFPGYISDVRITKGQARYYGGYAKPFYPHPTSA